MAGLTQQMKKKEDSVSSPRDLQVRGVSASVQV